MTLFACLCVAYVLTASIHTFDKRLIQAKKSGQDYGELPDWINIVTWLMWGIQIAMLVVDWKAALIAFAVVFFLAVSPILETIGNLICSPLRPR